MATIQFNLLPDVKLQYLKTQQLRRSVITVCVVISGVALLIFLLMLLTVEGLQKKQLNDAAKNINNYSSQLKGVDNLDRILTVRNQLTTLTRLHQNKHISSKIFGYLPQLTPTNVKIARLSLDFNTNSMIIDGTADAPSTVNTFIDTLKFTTYSVGAATVSHSAFPSVIESSFGLGTTGVGYTLNVTFDPQLFSNNLVDSQGSLQAVSLKVPNLTTTRSVLNDPANTVFNGQSNSPKPSGTGGQ